MSHHQASLTFNVTNPQLQPPEDVEQGQQQLVQIANAPVGHAPEPEGNGVIPIQREWHVVKGVGYLLLLLIYHGLCFVAFLSLSIGIAMLCSVIWELIRYVPLQPGTQSLVTLISLTMLGEIHSVGQSQGQLGPWISRKVTQHPVILGMFLPAIFVGLYFAALSQLYSQYLVVHPVVTPWWQQSEPTVFDGSDRIFTDSIVGASELEPDLSDTTNSIEDMKIIKKMNQATSLFMLSISYMIYITVKSTDWAYYRSAHYTFILHTLRLKFCTYFKHLWIQLLLLLVYTVPIGLLCVACHVFFLRPDITYVIIILTCAVIGIHAVIIESKAPFPVVPQQPPYYRFESHLVAKSTVTVYFLHAGLLAMFYKSNNKSSHSQHLQGPHHLVLNEDPFDFSDEIKFFMYTTLIGLIVIGTFKITLNVYYSKELIFWVQPPRPPTPVHVPEPNLPEEPEMGMEQEESTVFVLSLEEPTSSAGRPVPIMVNRKQLEDIAEKIKVNGNRRHANSSIVASTEPASSSSSSGSGSDIEENILLSSQTLSVTNLLPSSTDQGINTRSEIIESNNNCENTEQTSSIATNALKEDDKANKNVNEVKIIEHDL